MVDTKNKGWAATQRFRRCGKERAPWVIFYVLLLGCRVLVDWWAVTSRVQ